ncbi:SRPBCC domain-containing protein [Streptomyces sp. NPDC005485]|uniref:SRPBCC domain-containing protein n=1 Tax=Streptomyces sp. NPDC005485 TaxID=3155591 RepID=UPI0033B60552
MADIAMQLTIEAEADTVRDAVATETGIRSWLTPEAVVGEGVGAAHALTFPGEPESWRLLVTESGDRRLVLEGGNGPWTGTVQTYEIVDVPEGGVLLRFTHAGFPDQHDAYRNFTYAWAAKFTALKAYAETGRPVTFSG